MSTSRRILPLVLLLTCVALAAAPSLKLTRNTVVPGDELEVAFTAPPDLPDDAWVGIIPSDVPHGDEAVNDEHELEYEYLNGQTSGTLTFTAPDSPGRYDLRMNDRDDGGREIASVTFEVRRPDASGASLSLDRTTLAAGAELQVRFAAPEEFPPTAWVGVIPSHVPHGDEDVNDQHDLEYEYLDDRTSGTITFRAPAAAGSYDVRMHDGDGGAREVASVSFTVKTDLEAGEMAAQLEATGKLALYGIRFTVDSADITRDSAKALAQVGQLLIRDVTLRLRIEGHTDSTGSAAHNLELSQRRADSVRTYLVDTFGVEASRLETRGCGPDQPVATNDTEAGRALNRRVELVKL